MDIPVHILSAFVDDGSGGNLAGVVLDADNLEKQQKQAIAALVGIQKPPSSLTPTPPATKSNSSHRLAKSHIVVTPRLPPSTTLEIRGI